MPNGIIKSLVLVLLATSLQSLKVPKGWYKAGNKANKYSMGVDSLRLDNVGVIQSLHRHIRGQGALVQYLSADPFKGKRIKLSGMMKASNVKKRAGFWMRVQPSNSATPVPFDNMRKRAVKGNTNWNRYEIVLDVPENANYIAYGALLSGTGKIWFNDIKIEVVPKTIAVTGKNYSFQKWKYAHFANSTDPLEFWTYPE